MIETRPCGFGCKISRQHRSECSGTPCPGCLPRTAEVGELCRWCFNRLGEDVAIVPALVAHLKEIAKPEAKAIVYDRDGGSGKDPAERDPLHPAWHAAEALQHALVNAAREACRALHGHETPALGKADGPELAPVAHWLTTRLDKAAELEFIIEIRAELADLVSRARAMWPIEERSRDVEIPCPRCELKTLRYTPPRAIRHPFVVECLNPDCARILNENDWDELMAEVVNGGLRDKAG